MAPLAMASDGFEPIGNSVKARARGGADVAVGDSAMSQIENPATLSLSPRGHIALDGDAELALIHSEWVGPLDSATSRVKSAPLFNSGVAVPINDRLTLGAAMHSRGGLGTRYYMRPLLIPFMERRTGSDLKVIDIPLDAAYKVTDKLSLGFGPRIEVATARFGTIVGPADVEVGRGWATGFGFQGGLLYKPREDVSLGLAYRTPTWFSDLRGGKMKAALFGLVPVPLGDAVIDELELPQRISAGGAWDITKWLKLIGEVRWIGYSQSSLNKIRLNMDGLLNLHYPLPLGYTDQWAFITGAEFKLRKDLILGMGYHYCTPAVSASHMFPMGSILAEHHLTTGLRYEKEKWWAGIAGFVGIPESLSGGGLSKIPLGVDYGASTLHQAQHGVSIGFGYKF